MGRRLSAEEQEYQDRLARKEKKRQAIKEEMKEKASKKKKDKGKTKKKKKETKSFRIRITTTTKKGGDPLSKKKTNQALIKKIKDVVGDEVKIQEEDEAVVVHISASQNMTKKQVKSALKTVI